jgi:hypothetical protein
MQTEKSTDYGDSYNNPKTHPEFVLFGAGPRFCGASVIPVLASISASHSLEPLGRPTLSALRSAAKVIASSNASLRKAAKSPTRSDLPQKEWTVLRHF